MRFERRWPLAFSDWYRSRGAVDMMDLIVGLALLVLTPVLVVFLAGVLQKDTGPDMVRMGTKLEAPPDQPDREEIEKRWALAENAYRTNARAILKRMEDSQESQLREVLRKAAGIALKQASSTYSDLISRVEQFPDSKATFSEYVQRAESTRREIEGELTKLKSLDVLGVDG